MRFIILMYLHYHKQVARLGRVTVISDARGLGVGPQLIQVFIEYCKTTAITLFIYMHYQKKGIL
jgi:predicted GNAT family N-acyltransferase